MYLSICRTPPSCLTTLSLTPRLARSRSSRSLLRKKQTRFNKKSVYLSICLSVYLSICQSVYLSICVSVYMSICLSILFIYLSPQPPFHLGGWRDPVHDRVHWLCGPKDQDRARPPGLRQQQGQPGPSFQGQTGWSTGRLICCLVDLMGLWIDLISWQKGKN